MAVCSIEKHFVSALLPSDAAAVAAVAVAELETVHDLFGTCTLVAFDRIPGSLHNRNLAGKASSLSYKRMDKYITCPVLTVLSCLTNQRGRSEVATSISCCG